MSAHTTDVGGLSIAWEFCGGCGQHVKNCPCKGGPTPPAYIQKWVAAAPTSETATPVAREEIPTAAAPAVAAVTAAANKRACTGGCGTVCTEANADKNDDGTWTCYSCQIKGAEA